MSNSIVDLTVAIAEHGTLTIDPYAGNSIDVATRDGRYYSGLAPGSSWLLVPSYLLAKPVIDRLITPQREAKVQSFLAPGRGLSDWAPSEDRLRIVLASFACCCLGVSLMCGWLGAVLFMLLRQLYPSANVRLLATSAVGTVVCTNLFFYATSIDHRILACVLLVTALWLASGDSQAKSLLFGVVLGMSVATSYESVLVLPPVLLWSLRRKHCLRLALVVAGASLPLVLLFAYQAACFGNPLTTPYALRLDFQMARAKGWNSAFVMPLRESLLEALRSPTVFYDYLLGDRLGLFSYSPLLLLDFFLIVGQWRRSLPPRLVALALAATVSVVLFHLLTGYRGTGADFGPRFLMISVPFLALLLPGVRVPSVAFGFASALGLVVALRGVMYGLIHEPFWEGYRRLLSEHGLSSYTLLKWKAVTGGGGLGKIVSSTVVGLVLAGSFALVLSARVPVASKPSCNERPS